MQAAAWGGGGGRSGGVSPEICSQIVSMSASFQH